MQCMIRMKDLNEDLTTNFTSPCVLPAINDVYSKNPGSRVSVKGQIVKVSKILDSSSSRRRVMTLVDKIGQVDVKLWGDHAMEEREVNSTVQILAVEVAVFKDYKSLNSTPSTVILHVTEDEPFGGRVTAASFDESESSIFVDGEVLQIDLADLRRLYPSLEFSGEIEVKGWKNKGRVSIIHGVGGEEEGAGIVGEEEGAGIIGEGEEGAGIIGEE